MAERHYTMTLGQAEDGLRLCLDNVSHALDGAEIMCRHGGHETVAVYLYTVAIEEFGKALLLKDAVEKGGKNGPLSVPAKWFGGRHAHKAKFDRACSALPEECITYQYIDVAWEIEKMPRETATVKRLQDFEAVRQILRDLELGPCGKHGVQEPERIGKYYYEHKYDKVTGKHTLRMYSALTNDDDDAGRVHVAIPFDMATRKNMLYADWDDAKKRWNVDVTIGPTKFVPDDDDIRRNMEVEKEDEEVYPGAVLGAISAFRDELAKMSSLCEHSGPQGAPATP